MIAPSPNELNEIPAAAIGAPGHDCPLCPRMAALREPLRVQHPDWWNGPLPGFGDPNAWLGIIGLAPGMRGAHRTGRVFTGDRAGDLLFATLDKFGLSHGRYDGHRGDELTLNGAMIFNAVQCLPPENKPTPQEIRTCRPFAKAQADALPHARVYIALGQIAHQSGVKILGGRLPKCRFAHLDEHLMPDGRVLIDSYHPSRYNQNIGRLTAEMFEAVFTRAFEVRDRLAKLPNGGRRERKA